MLVLGRRRTLHHLGVVLVGFILTYSMIVRLHPHDSVIAFGQMLKRWKLMGSSCRRWILEVAVGKTFIGLAHPG